VRVNEQSSTGEGILLAVVALVGGLGLTVWSGAQAAALVFGTHELLGAGFGDAVTALPDLATHPGDPGAAWPATTARRLPGATAYWTSTLVAFGVVVLIAVTVAAVVLRGRVGLVSRRRMGLDPEGRFARGLDLLPMWVERATVGRIVLGWVGGRRPAERSRPRLLTRLPGTAHLVATENPRAPLDAAVPRLLRRRALERKGQRGSVIVLGPTQCGKTAALAVPAILEWAGPVIALSVKSDLMSATIARRRQLGQVRVFDPAAVTGEAGDTWSPLRGSSSLAGARRSARSIANATSWTQDSGEMGFWTDAGEDLLAGLFWVAATLGMGIDAIVRWVLTMDQKSVRTLLAPLVKHYDAAVAIAARQVLEAFDGVWRSDARQVSSVYLTARQMIRPWQEPTVQASSASADPRRTPIDLEWLLSEDSGPGKSDRSGRDDEPARPRAANTLYLCADLDEAERLAPVLGGLVDDLMKQAYARVGATDTPLDPPVLIVIDEAGNWPMRNLPGRISTCAGIGIQLMLVYQSKAQVDAAYERRADIVISNAVTKVFFAGLSDESTLRYAATLLGDEHVTARSTSADLPTIGGATGGRRSVSEQPTKVDLMPGSLLRQVRPGQALLVHNTLRPAHLHGRYWFLEPDLYELATGRRCSRRELAARARRPIAEPRTAAVPRPRR
jgi:type IV secretion system protein VirD4